jgi:3-oxoacyl-[acyl-carrier protein] reductase
MSTPVQKLFDLTGQFALVTGGSRGLGLQMAEALGEAGAKIMLTSRKAADLEEAVADLQAKGIDARWIAADASDPAQIQRVVDETMQRFGRIDILINNAGVTHLPQPLEDVSEDDFDRIFNVNMKAIYLAMRNVVPRLKANAPGHRGIRGVVLNVASTAGVSPRPRLGWYNASKGWVITATRANAVELAPFGIRVVALNPVAGETPLLKSFMGEDTPEIRAKFLSTIPIGRFSQPDDLANAACYLCSDEASMITGVCMEVDGGRCI